MRWPSLPDATCGHTARRSRRIWPHGQGSRSPMRGAPGVTSAHYAVPSSGCPPTPSPRRPAVRLLPAFDGLWLGYRDRDFLLPVQYRSRVYPGGGVIRPTILLDNHPVGTWTRRTRAHAIDVVVDFFEDPPAEALEELHVVAADLGHFLGQTVRLVS